MAEQVKQPEEEAAELLIRNNLTMSTAESCTGGMTAARLVNVSGISQVFMGGLITYSNEAKMRFLGVKQETLAAHGAVSEETALEMSAGGAAAVGTDVCVSITGLAGPDGGTAEKPVGLVYMACFLKGKNTVRRFIFKGDRKEIREQSAAEALKLVCHCLREYERENR